MIVFCAMYVFFGAQIIVQARVEIVVNYLVRFIL